MWLQPVRGRRSRNRGAGHFADRPVAHHLLCLVGRLCGVAFPWPSTEEPDRVIRSSYGDAVPRKPRPNKQIVAFKVEPELAALLDAMPNKSEFIRNAVARQLSTACPLCRGTGITPYSGVSDELTRLVQQHPLCVCAGCGVKVSRPCHTPGHCEEEPRIESF